MTANEFGNLLRGFRESCRDPLFPARKLSQQRFGELAGQELGFQGYSGAAVSDWERGKSKIHADDRRVLTALIKVLHERGGLETIEDANRFLEAGNYRSLNTAESEKIFMGESGLQQPASKDETPKSSLPFLIENFLPISAEELGILIAKARDGPKPYWPRALAALMRKASEQFSISITAILWAWVWLIAWQLMAPSLRLPFADSREMSLAMQEYVMGSLVVPLLIGALINTKDNEYWKRQAGVNPFLLRLYTYQGAGIGFNLGYFFVFPFSLAGYYLQMEYSVWAEILAVTVGLILGYMGARVVPHNLWLAYKRLKLSDGGIFFIVALLGPVWGFFFLEFYPVLLTPVTGVLAILGAVTIMAALTTRQPINRDR